MKNEIPALPETEKAVLSVLANRYDGWDDELIDIEMFNSLSHKKLFELLSSEVTPDLRTFSEKLMKMGLLNGMGGPSEIANIWGFSVRTHHFKSNVKKLQEYKGRREMVEVGLAMVAIARTESDSGELLEVIGEPVTKINETLTGTLIQRSKRELLSGIISNYEDLIIGKVSPMGWTVSLPTLSRALRGFCAPRYMVLSGYPSSGKTLMAVQFLLDIAKQDVPTMFLGCEMPTDQLMTRAIVTNGRFDPGILYEPLEYATRKTGGKPTKDNIRRVKDSVEGILALPIHFEEATAPQIGQVITMIRRSVKRNGVKVVAIDYLQLVRDSSAKGNKEVELTNISHALQSISKELGVMVIVLSQLNKEGSTKYATTTQEDVDYHLKIIQNSDDKSEDFKKVTGLLIDKDRHTSRSGYLIQLEKVEDGLFFEEVNNQR